MNMRYLLSLSLIFICLIACNSKAKKTYNGKQDPFNHQTWNQLLQKHVRANGDVDYKGFIKDKTQLNEYCNALTANRPNENWSKEASMAYWINVYNAFTVKLIVDHYPVESIKDIKNGIPFVNTVWDIKLIDFGDEQIDLNKVEHGILRKDYDEPRIHFAVNCASFSCPNLRNEAFTADRLEEQLADAARLFLKDERKNKIQSDNVQLSKIFSWFKGDFTKGQTLIEFLNKYAPLEINADANINHLDYDWTLNDVKD